MRKVTLKKLTKENRKFVIDLYNNTTSSEAQSIISNKFGVSERTVRNWFRKLDLTSPLSQSDSRVMVYDIETSRALAKVWWTGKQFIGHKNLKLYLYVISGWESLRFIN